MPSNFKKSVLGGVATIAVIAAGLGGPVFAQEREGLIVGGEDGFMDISNFCGDKEIRVALSVGSVGAHRQIKRAEFEDEAAKCPNIVEVGYADAGGNPEKELANIRSLAAQGYDIILVEPDSGAAAIPAMRDAMNAGAVVVPVEVGIDFPGQIGRDYSTIATPNQEQMAATYAQFVVDSIDGEGDVIVWGGVPGAAQTAAQLPGWQKVFAANPGINVLEGPVISNWDPAKYQEVMTALLTKYPNIDAMYADYGSGILGALRAFDTAGRGMVPVTGLDANGAQCYYLEHKADNPNLEIGFTSSWTWIDRLALRHGLAVLNGIETTEPNVVNVTLLVDSTSDDPALQPTCDEGVPPDVSLSSSRLTREQLIDVFK